jgi:hypothetical protein
MITMMNEGNDNKYDGVIATDRGNGSRNNCICHSKLTSATQNNNQQTTRVEDEMGMMTIDNNHQCGRRGARPYQQLFN